MKKRAVECKVHSTKRRDELFARANWCPRTPCEQQTKLNETTATKNENWKLVAPKRATVKHETQDEKQYRCRLRARSPNAILGRKCFVSLRPRRVKRLRSRTFVLSAMSSSVVMGARFMPFALVLQRKGDRVVG